MSTGEPWGADTVRLHRSLPEQHNSGRGANASERQRGVPRLLASLPLLGVAVLLTAGAIAYQPVNSERSHSSGFDSHPPRHTRKQKTGAPHSERGHTVRNWKANYQRSSFTTDMPEHGDPVTPPPLEPSYSSTEAPVEMSQSYSPPRRAPSPQITATSTAAEFGM